jgi:hypothetical protein
MDRTSDLNIALKFVIGRIEEQATLSGIPLDEDERSLLNNLPRTPSMPEISVGDPNFSWDFQPRDRTYEKLCALAKAAHDNDAVLSPTLLNWDFAFSVAKLNDHPLYWLLQWAGIKQRRPCWDRWLLVIAALLFLAVTLPLMLLVIDKPPALWRWVVVAVGGVGVVLSMYSASRRIEKRQLERNIEQFRSASRFVIGGS